MDDSHCIAMMATEILKERQEQRDLRGNKDVAMKEIDWAVGMAVHILNVVKKKK